MSTLNGELGAASPARAKVPAASAASMAARRDPSRGAEDGPDAADDLGRAGRPLEQRLGQHLGAAGLGVGGPGLARGHRLRVRGGVEEHVGYVNPGDAVDERMVALGHEGEAAALDLVDQPHLPQRLRAVEALGEHPGRQGQQLGLVAGGRERGVADVVAEVELRIVDPLRPALSERDRAQLLAEAGDQVQARLDVLTELVVGRRRALEQGRRGDVHVRRAVLEVEKRGVEAAEAI